MPKQGIKQHPILPKTNFADLEYDLSQYGNIEKENRQISRSLELPVHSLVSMNLRDRASDQSKIQHKQYQPTKSPRDRFP
jgi:hypothetical protein